MKAKEHKERPADPLTAIAGIRIAQDVQRVTTLGRLKLNMKV